LVIIVKIKLLTTNNYFIGFDIQAYNMQMRLPPGRGS